MQLERQLCPPMHARRLKELGVRQESLHYYSEKGVVTRTQSGFTTLGNEQEDESPAWWKDDKKSQEYDAAFTVAELGVALPPSINGVVLNMENNDEVKYVSYPRIKSTFGSTEAQARANMLIWLLENKYCTAGEVNERLIGVEE